MNKTIKVIYLLMMLLIVNTCVAFAQSEEKIHKHIIGKLLILDLQKIIIMPSIQIT